MESASPESAQLVREWLDGYRNGAPRSVLDIGRGIWPHSPHKVYRELKKFKHMLETWVDKYGYGEE